MKIVILCEGATEAALKMGLREFVQRRAAGPVRIGIETRSLNGPVLRKKVGRILRIHLADANVLGVVALTDVYPDFTSAAQAKTALQQAAGEVDNERFRAHAAQFDLEAWILPFWDEIAASLGVQAKRPGARPEEVNNQRPPSVRLKELFERAKRRYEKPIDGPKWLTADRLERAADQCSELKLFLSSILELADGKPAFPAN